jgi:hypothetical protein
VECLEQDLPPARFALDLDDRIERDESNAEIGRVCRDAARASSQYGVEPVVAAAGVAAGPGLAFVAGARRIIKIGASRPLQEIAADRRRIAQLCRGAGQKRFGNGRKAPGEMAIVGKIGVAHQRADAHAAIGKIFDPVEAGKMRDVDEPIGLRYVALHQIEKIRAGGEIDGARFRGG